MTTPRVSVCIPVYNCARYLSQAIESVLRQRFDNFEILVIDNNSTDSSVEVVQEFAARDSRVRLLTNPDNLGMVPNWDRCLFEARGEYIKFLFADDLLVSRDALGRMVKILDEELDVSLVASARNVIDKESRVVETMAGYPDGLRIQGMELINQCLTGLIHQHNPIGEPSVVMFRRKHSARGFDPRYRQLVDLEMWFHLLEQGTFAYIGEPLCAFRRHEEQQTVKNRQDLSHFDDMFYLLKDYLGRPYTGLGWMTKHRAIFWLAYTILQEVPDRDTALQKIGAHILPLNFSLQLSLYRLSTYINKRINTLTRKFRVGRKMR